MKRRCAWCGIIYGHKEPLDVGITTHGACDPCLQRIRQNIARLEGEIPKPTAVTAELWISPGSSLVPQRFDRIEP